MEAITCLPLNRHFKPVALAIVELRKSEGIRQAGRQLVS